MRSAEVSDEQKKARDDEIDDLQSIVSDLDLKIQDAYDSKQQVENTMNNLRTRIGLPSNKGLCATTQGDANDITSKVCF